MGLGAVCLNHKMQSIIKPRKDELDPGPKCVQTNLKIFVADTTL